MVSFVHPFLRAWECSVAVSLHHYYKLAMSIVHVQFYDFSVLNQEHMLATYTLGLANSSCVLIDSKNSH